MVMDNPEVPPTADELLFGRGLELDDYFIERTPVSEVICFKNGDGRVFDLAISNPDLRDAALNRLVELGVRVVEIK